MDISSTDSKILIAEAKAVAKSGDNGSKSDEFAATLASLLGKTGSRMGGGSNNGLQSSSSEGIEDGNLGGGNGKEMTEARQSVHGDNDDAPMDRDDRPASTTQENRNDYNDSAPVANDDSYRTDNDSAQHNDSHDSQASENPNNEPSDNNRSADTSDNNSEQNAGQNQDDGNVSANAGEQNNQATDTVATAVASGAQAALASGMAGVLKTGDTPVIAVTTQLQGAMAADKATNGANQSGQTTGRENATDGLKQALNALGKETGATANSGAENVEGDANKKGSNGAALNKGTAKAAVQNQMAGANANVEAKVAENMPREISQAGRNAEAATAKATQAAAIAKAVGADANLSVEVKVENTADTLVSRPRTSLTPTAIGDGAKSQTQAQTQTQGINTNAQQALMQTGQQIAGQAQAQLGGNNAAKVTTMQGAAVQAATGGASSVSASAGAAISGGAEGISNLSQNQNTQHAANTQKPEAPAPSHRNVMEQVTVQITKAVNAGVDKIDIQLRPASLGRVDVRLEMMGDGRVSVTVLADNRDTLDMLQRGARDLTSALSDAGLQTDSQDLNFSLREQANQNAGNGNSGKDEQLDFNETENQSISSNDIDDPAALEAALRRSISEGRIDIRA